MRKLAAIAFLALLSTLARGAETGGVRVFEAGALPLDRYTVIERLWTGTWRSAFWLPEYDDASAAISALTRAAQRRGADGVVNLHCLREGGRATGGYACYGLAIRLKQ